MNLLFSIYVLAFSLIIQLSVSVSGHAGKSVSFLKLVYPSKEIKFIGQVGGIDKLKNGHVAVLHRGNRTWNAEYNTYI